MKQVVVELVGGFCNSRCVWCFTTYKCLEKMNRGMMSLENFARFIDLNRKSPFNIIPFSHGEALLHPDFVKCCELARTNGFPLQHLHTNFALSLTDGHFDTLARFKEVVVNVGGGKSATHYSNMKTNLNAVLSNLQRLSQRNSKNIKVKMVLNIKNIDECDILNHKIKEINPEISVGTYPVYFGPADSDNEDKAVFLRENIITEDTAHLDKKVLCRDEVDIKKNGRIEVSSKLKKCYGLIPTVRWDGSVNICCRERYHDRSEGDAFAVPLKTIRKSKTYKAALKLGRKRKYIDYCHYCS